MTVALDHIFGLWRSTPRPVDNFLAERGSALTYGIECDLEHQADYIRVMIEAIASGNRLWNYELRTRDELQDLADFRSRLEALELPEETTRPFYRYMETTRALLEQVLQDVARYT